MKTHILFILLLVLLWFDTTTTSFLGHKLVVDAGGATNTCIDNERRVLLDFAARLQEPGNLLSLWRSDEEDDCCKWDGVVCDDQTRHVTELHLIEYTSFIGEISLSLLNLTYLNTLELSYCSFHGTILPLIGSMTQLTYLDLSYNQFTGSIPMSIGSLTDLTFLNLEGNQFVGNIPMSICYLTNLTDLYLNNNNFHGNIPESIGSLTKLTGLSLAGNNFSGIIPRSIGSLTKLTTLNLEYNSLHGTIPPEIGNLTNLQTLSLRSLGNCRVESLDWLSSLSYLGDLSMDGISLATANNWVNVILGLRDLQVLTLSGCDLSKVMHPYYSVVNSFSAITNLNLNNNNLNASICRWLCSLVGNRLQRFDVSGNTIDGKLSDFLNNLARCTSPNVIYSLDASNNQLTGLLSDEIQNFSSLNMLNLDSNHLNGTISDKLWQLPTLQELHLSSNSLGGVISENIEKSNLLYVDLSRNSLEGVLFNDNVSSFSTSVGYIDFSSNKLGPFFPKSIQKMGNLRHLDLSNNSISDTIPIEYWNQWCSSQLTYLDLSFNNISGILPESLSSSKLEVVDLSSNSFYGPVPTFPASISFLDLSHNSLTGLLPNSLKNLTYLKVLNLGHNTLSGCVPTFVGYLGQLETLSLYNNNFSGELPLSLNNCTKLSLLDLGGNKLYGNIPIWIGKSLSRLYALSLKSNNFSGAIPSEICELVSLQILDFSFNNLHGTIPSCVRNLTSMFKQRLSTEQNLHHYSTLLNLARGTTYVANSYIDSLSIEWHGNVNEFTSTLGLVKIIDLSTNSLTGNIPFEITNLQGLMLLNLSHNALLGEIPIDIGQMTELQILDLSKNSFSGGLPSSMNNMNFLNYLDVSHNNLSGRIPSGTQLQRSEPSRYIGNAGLCGPPLTQYCPGDRDPEITLGVDERKSDGQDIDEFKRWFYIGGGAGYVTGFWLVFGALLLNRRARYAFFQCHQSLKDWAYVKVMVFMAKFRRVAHA